MRKIPIALAASLVVASQGFAMDSLSQFDWKNRVVVVFGQHGDDRFDRQVDILKSQTAELAERDMVVLKVSNGEVEPVYGMAKPIDAEKLRREAKADGRFVTILVGKDGGVKLRSDKIVDDVEIFDLIDRMPMRRREKG